jgi:hypothetical protein
MDDQKLKDYFKFNEADLQANRSGAFSPAQKQRLSGRQGQAIRQKQIAVAIALPLALIMLGLMGYLIFRSSVLGLKTDPTYSFFLGLCGFPLLLAAIYIFRLSFLRQKYLLKKAEGPINIIKEQRRSSDGHHYTHYELHVGGKTFRAASELGDVMLQGDTYAVYYAEGEVSQFPEIVSAERMGTAK